MIIRLTLTVWLLYVAWSDLRRSQVSNLATVPPLLAVTVGRLLIPGGWPVALMFALILVSAQWPRLTMYTLAWMGLCLWWAIPAGLETTIGVWMLCFFLWQAGVIGGADAKVVMFLTALFPDGHLVWCLLVAWFSWSVGVLVLRFRDRIPQSLLKAVSGLVRLQVDGETRYPALPAVALGGLIYLWYLQPT